jgi:hypothetical protein
MKSRSVYSRRFLLFILILVLSSQACAISLIKWPTFPTASPSNTNVPSGPAPTDLPRAQVTFTVRLPDPLAANEVLALSILDEVTGLALNAVDYPMTAVDTITYTATLAIRCQHSLSSVAREWTHPGPGYSKQLGR